MGFFNNRFRGKKKSEQVFQVKREIIVPDFENYNEFDEITLIFDYVFSPHPTIANYAAKTIHRLFSKVSAYENNKLYHAFKFLKIHEGNIKRFERFNVEYKTTLLCIASMNNSGFIREASLIKLAEIKSQRTIPFILFRLADWVLPIREKAGTIFKSFTTEDFRFYFIQNQKLIHWLLAVRRTDLSGLFNEIADVITSTPLKSEELNMLSEGERFYYFMSFVRQEKLNDEIIFQMLDDKYYLIRLLVIKNIDHLNDTKAILLKLLSDKTQKVRKSAIALLENQNIEGYEEILQELIFDISFVVRHSARKLLDTIVKQDYQKKYKDSLSNRKHIVGSVLGLSEVTEKSDIVFIKSFLDSEQAGVKSAALTGIYNLDKDMATEIAYQVIQNVNPAKAKKVAEMILSNQGIDYERLREIYDKTDISGRMLILRLFHQYGGWSVAGDFLKAMNENETRLKHVARSFLRNWEHYTISLATDPKPADKDYVMKWYAKTIEKGVEVPGEIPFIFGER
jgi:hypothetical protein